MTTLFVKITNQMITNCKQHIKAPGKLWEQDPQVLIANMEQCLKLYEVFRLSCRLARSPCSAYISLIILTCVSLSVISLALVSQLLRLIGVARAVDLLLTYY